MVRKIRNQDISHKAFTLIEMVIVLVIIGIMLMATVFLSSKQIQKVKDKTVKESILAEIQSRYSRNLGSSSFAGKMYDSMDVTFSGGSNKFRFEYKTKDNTGIENTFTDRFEIRHIVKNYVYNHGNCPSEVESITLIYSPYQISCKIGEEENSENNVVLVISVNDNKDYCFEINKKNCRLKEMTELNCETLEAKLKNC